MKCLENDAALQRYNASPMAKVGLKYYSKPPHDALLFEVIPKSG